MEEFISLYDYLGKAAGSQLGKDVAHYAALENLPFKKRNVSNPRYTGGIMLYTRDSLDNFFKVNTKNTTL